MSLLSAALLAACGALADERWVVLKPARWTTLSGATMAAQPDGSLLVQGNCTATDLYTFVFDDVPKTITAFRIEVLPDDSLPCKGPGRSSNGNLALSEVRAFSSAKGARRSKPIALQNVSANWQQDGMPVSMALDGVSGTAWGIYPKVGEHHELVVETQKDLQVAGNQLTLELEFGTRDKNNAGRLRLSATDQPRPVRAAGAPAPKEWSEIQARINQAIDRGVEALLALQLLDGSWDVDQANYRNGATSLAVYALLKSGVPKSHPAIVRALEFLRGGAPRETYTLGCQLMALATLKDPAVDPWMKQLGEALVHCQQPNGGFSYGFQAGIDLSNSQYGALGLRAAAQHGFKVDADVWEKLAAFTLGQDEESGSGGYAPLGFKYAPTSVSTGSMTAAGIAILAICEEQLKGRSKIPNLIGSARRGAEWLGQNFAVDVNPRQGGEWTYYWLYGAERVGALLETEEFGPHRWYREGAEWLVARQDGDGKWSVGGNGPVCSTSWALLFLTRATNVASGSATRAVKTWGGEEPKQPLSIRASGDTPLTFWIAGWGDGELDAYEWPQEKERGLRVKQVEWFATGFAGKPDLVPLARIEKPADTPCGRERFGGQFTFPLPGKYSLFARATIVAPPEAERGAPHEVALESPLVEVTIAEALDPELVQYARDGSRNLLAAQKPTITASSTLNDFWETKRLCDGLLARGWAGKEDDLAPRLTIELEKPTRGNLLLFTPATIGTDHPRRLTRIAVTLNGKGPPIEVAIDPSPWRKTKLRLAQPQVIRRIELQLLDATPTDAVQKAVGLAEVELQVEQSSSKK